MSLTKNSSKFSKSKQVDKRRFILGSSACYFEPAQAFNTDMTAEKLAKVILGECKDASASTTITETEGEGKSLNVRFIRDHTDENGAVTQEVQHVGLITASDWSMTLTEDHIDEIKNHVATEQIVERTNTKSVMDMF
jgi:hypothetical protein